MKKMRKEIKCKKNYKQFLKSLSKLNMLNDAMFSYVMNDIKCVKLILNIILSSLPEDIYKTKANEICLSYTKTQHAFRGSYNQRNIILDSYSYGYIITYHGDKIRCNFDIEMQRANSGASVKRARYYNSVLDCNSLNSGERFDNLPDNYIIFITEKDIFHENKPIYYVQNSLSEVDKDINNGSHIIYINTSYKNEDTAIGKLIHDFLCANPNDMYYNVIADSVRYYKKNTKGVNIMYNYFKNSKNIYEEGKNECAKTIAKKLILDGSYDIYKISEMTNLSVEELQKLQKTK